MKTKYKYIEMRKSKKADAYIIKSLEYGYDIGVIEWHNEEGQYFFCSAKGILYSKEVLKDINNFLEQLKQERVNKEKDNV